MNTKKTPATPTIDPLAVRLKLRLNQTEFWGRLGVTQSAGSRYESGRNVPAPTKKLLVIAYGTERQRGKMLESLA